MSLYVHETQTTLASYLEVKWQTPLGWEKTVAEKPAPEDLVMFHFLILSQGTVTRCALLVRAHHCVVEMCALFCTLVTL